MGGCNHAHIALDGCVTTDAVELPVRKHAQQACLQIKRHIANFIEKECAAFGLFKATTALGLGARERATFVTKQLGLQQIFWNGGRVDGYKGAIGYGRVLVQCACDELLACARLTSDQHGHCALAQAANGAEDILHGWGLSQHFRHGTDTLFGDQLMLGFFHGTADQLYGLGQVKRLGQIFECAVLECRDCTVQIRICRHDDDGQARVLGVYLFQQLQAGAARHANIADQYPGALMRWITLRNLCQCMQHFTRVAETSGFQILASQRLF